MNHVSVRRTAGGGRVGGGYRNCDRAGSVECPGRNGSTGTNAVRSGLFAEKATNVLMTAAKIVIASALLAGAAVSGIGPAQAQPVAPGASGPYHWCPGDRWGVLHPDTGRGGPPMGTNWDMSVCHTWWGVVSGHGNVGPSVWDGPDPPPPDALVRPACGFPFMCSGTP